MKHLLLVLAFLAVGAPVGATAGVAPRPCTKADFEGLPAPSGFMTVSDDDDLKTLPDDLKHDALFGYFKDWPPKIQYPYGSLDAYGTGVVFVAGVDGRVVCASIAPGPFDEIEPARNPKRQALLETTSEWRFVPFLEDGKPTAVAGWMPVSEEELPARHVPMPSGNPAEMTITYDYGASHVYQSAYHVELHGDGTAIYTDDSPLGSQSYHVDPKAVQGLLAEARAADFWSQRDLYRERPDGHLSAYSRTNITLGGKTKSVTGFEGSPAGMPRDVDRLAAKIADVAGVRSWQTLSLARVEQMKANGFDFTSDRAGHLLVYFGGGGTKEEVLLAIMDLGAPVGFITPEGEPQGLLDLSLRAGHQEMVRRLVARGALLDDGGKVDMRLVNRAFLAAVDSGEVAGVDVLLPFHPDMTYADPDDPSVRFSVICRLGDWQRFYRDGAPQDMAQRLLALGADINARDAEGKTLLRAWVNDLKFARFLLDNGADINAVDKKGATPLAYAYGEEAALFLLSRGADPRLGRTAEFLRYNITHSRWRKVKTWLEGHGYADLLTAPSGEDKPEKS